MTRIFTSDVLKSRTQKTALYIQVAVLAVAGISPMLLNGSASAEQLTSRKVTIGTSQISTATTNTFAFTIPTAGNVGSIEFLYCTTPLGTCTAPTGFTSAAATLGTQTGVTGFTLGPTTANSVRITRTAAAVTANTATTIILNNVTNPSTQNTSFYPRITTYSDSAYTTAVDTGVVAASTAQQLTVNGRVQENLNFCVAAIGDGGAGDTTLPANTTACSAVTTTVVDLGVVDNTLISRSPVDNSPTQQGNDFYGVAMISTNASSGVAVTFFAEDGTGTQQLKSFRVPGAACNASATTLTDQCFQSAAITGTVMAAGTERFGMNIPCIIGGAANGTPVVSTTTNLTAATAFNGNGVTTSAANCEDTEPAATKYAWNDTATAVQIAQSSTVVDNEAIKLNFAATASATTPTGSYTVKSTYIATPTF